MTASTRHLHLDPALHRRLISLRGHKLRCKRCGLPLKNHQDIISKPANGNNYKIKYYHQECWENLFMEL